MTTNPNDPAFTLTSGDRFHRIIVSDGVKYEVAPGFETVITFFIIRRAKGTYDIINVTKTFKEETCVSRAVQTKVGIPSTRISDEIDAVRIQFALGIEKATGLKLKWHELDLSGVDNPVEQVERIRVLGWVSAISQADYNTTLTL